MNRQNSPIGKYQEKDILLSRIPTIDVTELGVQGHHFKALLEVDVTRARELFRDNELRTGKRISFTGWVVKCISRSMETHREVNSFIDLRKRKLVTFEDIDISVIIEKEDNGEKVPLPLVVRRTNEKTLDEISAEIYDAKRNTGTQDFRKRSRLEGILLRLPQPIRMIFWRKVHRDPFFGKKTMGTSVVTSVGMFNSVSGWMIPHTIFTTCFALGSIVKKPGVIDDQVLIREYLYMTILFDHDVIDGGPAARFMGTLLFLLENGDGLSENA